MPQSFQKVVESILPDEEKLLSRLHTLNGRDRQGLAEYFGITLPEFDLMVAMPHTEPLAEDLAKLRGLSLVVAQHNEQTDTWHLPFAPQKDEREDQPEINEFSTSSDIRNAAKGDVRSVVIITDQLNTGISELKIALLAGIRGWRVLTIAAIVERTNTTGRARVELQGINIRTAVQIADTPRGLVMERRFPQPSLLV